MMSCMIPPERHRDRPITSTHGVLFVAMLVTIFGTMPAQAQRAGSSVGSRLHSTARYAASKRALAAGQGSVRQLLRLMDADKNGVVSKEEFLQFMSEEF